MNIGGFFKIASMLAITAATGGAAAPMLTQMLMKVVVQMAIQKLGQEMGIQPAIINAVTTVVMGQMGGPSVDFSNAANNPMGFVGSNQDFLKTFMQFMSPAEQGGFNRSMNQLNSAFSNAANLVENNEGLLEGLVEQNGWTSQYNAAMANVRGLQPQSSNVTGNYRNLEDLATQARARGETAAADRYDAQAELAQNESMSIQDFINDMNMNQSRRKTEQSVREIMAGKGSIIMKLAIVLGMIADQKMNDMASKAEQIGNMGKIKAGNQAKFAQMNAELQALGQELGIISQALTNVLKSLGEAAQTMARQG